jgi:hypothetical protein
MTLATIRPSTKGAPSQRAFAAERLASPRTSRICRQSKSLRLRIKPNVRTAAAVPAAALHAPVLREVGLGGRPSLSRTLSRVASGHATASARWSRRDRPSVASKNGHPVPHSLEHSPETQAGCGRLSSPILSSDNPGIGCGGQPTHACPCTAAWASLGKYAS